MSVVFVVFQVSVTSAWPRGVLTEGPGESV